MKSRGNAHAAAVLAALWVVLAPAYSLAADDRQEPRRPGLVKRAVHSFLSDDETEGGRGLHVGPFFPRLEIVSSGAGLAPMLHFWAPDIAGTRLAGCGKTAVESHAIDFRSRNTESRRL